jgi:hypothetical protein
LLLSTITDSNRLVEKFGMPHWQQVQDAFDGSRAL